MYSLQDYLSIYLSIYVSIYLSMIHQLSIDLVFKTFAMVSYCFYNGKYSVSFFFSQWSVEEKP